MGSDSKHPIKQALQGGTTYPGSARSYSTEDTNGFYHAAFNVSNGLSRGIYGLVLHDEALPISGGYYYPLGITYLLNEIRGKDGNLFGAGEIACLYNERLSTEVNRSTVCTLVRCDPGLRMVAQACTITYLMNSRTETSYGEL